MCGRKSRAGFKGIVTGLFLLSLVVSPCFAAASWGAFISTDTEEVKPFAMIEEPILGEQSQNNTSGTVQTESLEEPSVSSEKPATPPVQENPTAPEIDTAVIEKGLTAVQNAGYWISAEDKVSIENALVNAGDNLAALRESSDAKDKEIADLKGDLALAEKETGSKAYLMLDGVVGFNESLPEFGLGLTVGTRIGNSLMLEAGADYMIGGMSGIQPFSLDNFQFRTGIGWMF